MKKKDELIQLVQYFIQKVKESKDMREAFMSGARNSIPIVLGYIPIGITYGLLAVNTGLTPWETVLMSIIVFAGSSQLICVTMIGAGAGMIPIIMMTFLVNLRHLLMSASLSLHFKKTSRRLIPLLGFLITDESFAVSSASIDQYEDRGIFFFGLGITAYSAWVISSLIGVVIGRLLPISNLPVLDFVLPAMFIVLLVMQIEVRKDVLIAFISGSLSIMLIYILPGNWNIILATVITATIGVVLEKYIADSR
ncbi:MAG: AzlC family ABC transporter permease [Halanaerobiales bacterium]